MELVEAAVGGAAVGGLAGLAAFGITLLGFFMSIWSGFLRTCLFMPAYWWVLPNYFPNLPDIGFFSTWALFVAAGAVASVFRTTVSNNQTVNSDNK